MVKKTKPVEIHHDHLDQLAVAMRRYRELCGRLPGLLKADIDAAYRRVPLNPQHRWAATVAYKHNDKVLVCFVHLD